MRRSIQALRVGYLAVTLACPAAEVAAAEVREFMLDNGLKLIVQEDHRAPVVVSQVWYKVGSSYEHEGITGVSHALEHMMFQGTERHPAGEFSRLISASGGEENAFTGSDYTAYFQKMAKENLSLSFELEADRMRGLTLPEQEFAKEIKVVMEERPRGCCTSATGGRILIGRVTWDTDSGETSDDGVSLGGGFHELQGSLTMTKRQDPLVFIGSASYGTTFEKDDINPGDQLGFSVGALLAASPETSLRVILNQTFVNELEVGDRAIGGSDQVFGTLNFGASSIIGRGKFLDLTAGIGLTDEAPDYSVGISVSFRLDVPTRF